MYVLWRERRPAWRDESGVGRRAFLRAGDDLLLIRPDHHPDVQGHHRAEDRAGVDVERAAAEVADALEEAVDAGEEHRTIVLATSTFFTDFMIRL